MPNPVEKLPGESGESLSSEKLCKARPAGS